MRTVVSSLSVVLLFSEPWVLVSGSPEPGGDERSSELVVCGVPGEDKEFSDSGKAVDFMLTDTANVPSLPEVGKPPSGLSVYRGFPLTVLEEVTPDPLDCCVTDIVDRWPGLSGKCVLPSLSVDEATEENFGVKNPEAVVKRVVSSLCVVLVFSDL